jgi:hypothetical protein
MNQPNSSLVDWSEVRFTLTREILTASGRRDAFQFALDCQGDLARLLDEITDNEHAIAHPTPALREAMNETASPRIYKEGYLAGLRDAYELIVAINNRSDTEASRTTSEYSVSAHSATAIAEDQSDYPYPPNATKPTPPSKF